MVGNQLLSFRRSCSDNTCVSKKHSVIKLVIQVEHGKIWLPKGMKVSNYPKVIISQPLDSLPVHLKDNLTAKRHLSDTGKTRSKTRTNSQFSTYEEGEENRNSLFAS